MKKRMWWGVVGVVLTLTLSACSAAPAESSREQMVGVIAFYTDPVQVSVPSTAERGRPFEVEVTTYGGGCSERGEIEVELEGLRAEVTPYDYLITPPPSVPCTSDIKVYTHTATLSFAATGTAEVVFYGQEKTLDGTSSITVTLTLEVR